MLKGKRGALFAVKSKSSPHPALRATFSRKREKGLHRGLRRTTPGLADCSAARCHLSRKREKRLHRGLRRTTPGLADCSAARCHLSRMRERMPGGQVRALFAVKSKSSTHPTLRAPFSRKREKGLHRGLRLALHTLESGLVRRINTRQLNTQASRQRTRTHQFSRSNHVRMEVTIVHQGRHLRTQGRTHLLQRRT